MYFQKDCPSGELSRSKFLDIYRALFPDGKVGAFYEHVFRTFDEDGSGKIDFKEFLHVRSTSNLTDILGSVYKNCAILMFKKDLFPNNLHLSIF